MNETNHKEKNKQAIVAIPVYKTDLSPTEQASFAQVNRVLGHHDICLFAPESLDIAPLLEKWGTFRVERFADRYFISKASYSELLLTSVFYQRFANYEYLLIYQFDAFVFSDRLNEFCAMGYDYIGAPVNLRDRWADIWCSVGNGGLSLRNIDSALRVLEKKELVFRRKPKKWEKNFFLSCEDLFFSFCGKIPELDFHVPTLPKALEFAVSYDVAHAYERIPKWLPFGCHAWPTVNYWAWKSIIESYGYTLPEIEHPPKELPRQRKIEGYLLRRMQKQKGKHHIFVLDEMRRTLLEKGRPIALWGGGLRGMECIRSLKEAQVKIAAVIDRKGKRDLQTYGVMQMSPDFKAFRARSYFILVTTTKYEDEICAGLSTHGFVEGQDYMRMTKFMRNMEAAYLRSFRVVRKEKHL